MLTPEQFEQYKELRPGPPGRGGRGRGGEGRRGGEARRPGWALLQPAEQRRAGQVPGYRGGWWHFVGSRQVRCWR